MNKEHRDLVAFDNEQRRIHQATYIAGFDEAGRGPLAGPVSTAGVVLPPDYKNDLINDSKKLTDKQRRKLFEEIKEVALAYYVCLVPVETIDVTFDKPYMYIIRDKVDGEVWFVGSVYEPTVNTVQGMKTTRNKIDK